MRLSNFMEIGIARDPCNLEVFRLAYDILAKERRVYDKGGVDIFLRKMAKQEDLRVILGSVGKDDISDQLVQVYQGEELYTLAQRPQTVSVLLSYACGNDFGIKDLTLGPEEDNSHVRVLYLIGRTLRGFTGRGYLTVMLHRMEHEALIAGYTHLGVSEASVQTRQIPFFARHGFAPLKEKRKRERRDKTIFDAEALLEMVEFLPDDGERIRMVKKLGEENGI